MKTKEMFLECPWCGSQWGLGTEEFEWQQCDCCGYPDEKHGEDEDYADDYDEDYNYDYYDDDYRDYYADF
ncbi:MAG: hypothetical protein HGGPFJEG_01458 [Ignavibacteria bacterium]|nr:hypothetical protein [Ignavibacteria bacterium]